MKKLTTTIDSRNREIHGVYEVSDFINYYQSPSGETSNEIPAGAVYVGIATEDEGLWYSFGDDEVSVVVPTDTVEDGSAPAYLIPNARVIHRIFSETHLALQSDGNVTISYWGQ